MSISGQLGSWMYSVKVDADDALSDWLGLRADIHWHFATFRLLDGVFLRNQGIILHPGAILDSCLLSGEGHLS